MAITKSITSVEPPSGVQRALRGGKPPMSNAAIMIMTIGFFGQSFGWNLQGAAINPLFLIIGADPHDLPILNIAGPLTALLIQPVIGAASDRTWSDRWGRRKPYIVAASILAAVVIVVFPFVGVLWGAVVCLWLLDMALNTIQEPYRALLGDRLPDNQLARGFLAQAFYGGAGAVIASLCLYFLQKLLPGSGTGVPPWLFATFFVGAASIAITAWIGMRGTTELRPSDEDLAEMRAAPKGPGAMVVEIGSAVRQMPRAMHKIGLVFIFQWYALPIYWQYLAVANGELFFDADPETGGTAWETAVAWTGMQGAVNNSVQACVGLFVLVAIIQKVGAKKVQVVAYILAAVALAALTQTSGNQWLGLVALIGFGLATASMFALPAMTVTTLVPAKRLGIYMAIMNMMMVVPMILQSLTFGWIYENLLGSSATNAFLFAAGLFAVGAIAMLWVDPPSADEESFLVPLGAPRHVKSVYNRVIVGSDGSPTSLVTVGHAAGLAHAAEAKLVVVTAYDEGTTVVKPATAGLRQVLTGKDAADAAMRASLKSLEASTDHHIKEFEGRVVAAGPAQALLDAAGDDPSNLIVVGNRGLGAEEGQLLGSVPTEVVRNAVCNVMIVQTTRHSEDLQAMTGALEVQTLQPERD